MHSESDECAFLVVLERIRAIVDAGEPENLANLVRRWNVFETKALT